MSNKSEYASFSSRGTCRKACAWRGILGRVAFAFMAFAWGPLLFASGPLRIVASTTMVADLARSVAGDRGEVAGLMGPGVDPHLYKASASDINLLQSGDVIFYNGLHLEGRLGDVLERLGRRGKRVHALAERIPKNQLLETSDRSGHYDPHIWFDPRLWALCVDGVVDALTAADPAGKAYYEAQGKRVQDAYLEHYRWGKEYVSKLTESQRILVTSHDAYNYFGRAFGFLVLGVQGISTQSEAGLADIVKIIDFVKSKRIKAIFAESSVSPAAIQRISQDSGAKIGGELFSDAMGLKGQIQTAADGSSFDLGTYEGMLKGNIATIVDALQ